MDLFRNWLESLDKVILNSLLSELNIKEVNDASILHEMPSKEGDVQPEDH